jgi:YD repeat-containing protein
MKAYKATNRDMTCKNVQYELEKEFVHEGELKLCESGFHFCKELKHINSFYSFCESDHRFFEIEIPEDAIVMDDSIGEKSVTNKIKFVRELDASDFEKNGFIREYDSKGNVIHIKNSNGFEKWREYDSNGNCIHSKNSDGFESWREYDSNGNVTHNKDSTGYEWWREYDSNGNMIYYKNPDGYEYWKEYDSKGNVIHIKNSTGYEKWYEYDSNGNIRFQWK